MTRIERQANIELATFMLQDALKNEHGVGVSFVDLEQGRIDLDTGHTVSVFSVEDFGIRFDYYIDEYRELDFKAGYELQVAIEIITEAYARTY